MNDKIKFDLVAENSLMLYIHKLMQTRISYTETMKQVLGIIFIPVGYIGIMVTVLFSFNLDKLSENMVFGLIMVVVVLSMAASLFTIFRFIMENGVASFDQKGLHVQLYRRTFLYPHKDFFIAFDNIADAALNLEPGKSKFINLTTRVPSKSMMIFPEGYIDSTKFDDFWEGLNREIQHYNETAPAKASGIIKSKGFYEARWAKVLAWVSLIITAWLSFLKIGDPESVSGLKLLMLYAYTVPFCYAVFRPK